MLETKAEMPVFAAKEFLNIFFNINTNILLKTDFKNVEIGAETSASRHPLQLQCTTWMLCLEFQKDEVN